MFSHGTTFTWDVGLALAEDVDVIVSGRTTTFVSNDVYYGPQPLSSFRKSSSSSSSLSKGAIAGIVVASISLAGALVFMAVVRWRRSRKYEYSRI